MQDQQFLKPGVEDSSHVVDELQMDEPSQNPTKDDTPEKNQLLETPPALAKPRKNTSAVPYTLIEGPEPSQDISYKWVLRNPKVQLIEKGIKLGDFPLQHQVRDLSSEFRLVRKLTETKDHLRNQEIMEKAA